jgi:phosphohistidine phosphatase
VNLFLLRHGIAEELGAMKNLKDADRALTREGKQKSRAVARAIVRLDLSFDRILSSPYRRARETAAILSEHVECRRAIELCDALTPAGSFKALLDLLQRLSAPAEDVLLVGHEPYLSELVSMLIFGEKSTAVVIKKAGLCKLSVPSLCYGRCATLEWLLTPKQMLLLS